MTELTLRSNLLSTDAVIAIEELLQHNTILTSIDLRGNDIELEGLCVLEELQTRINVSLDYDHWDVFS